MSFLHRPQQVLVRRLLFQIHVWTGLVTALYAIFIGITGAALVFRADLQKWTYPAFFAQRANGADPASAEAPAMAWHGEHVSPPRETRHLQPAAPR